MQYLGLYISHLCGLAKSGITNMEVFHYDMFYQSDFGLCISFSLSN